MGVTEISFDLNEPPAITFAPNMTEATFQNPEEPESVESDLLFPPAETDSNESELLGTAKHSKKKDKDHIPRPPNAFILFRSSFIKQQHIPGSIEGNHSQLSKIVGACWQRLSYEERQVWERKAKLARAEHKRLYPNYRFVRSRNPKSTPKEKPPPKFVNTIAVPQTSKSGSDSKGAKLTTMVTTTSSTQPQVNQRSTRKRTVASKTAEDPRRCEQIARLLVAGHKGSSLEAMVQKFDEENAKNKQTCGLTMTEVQTPERMAKGTLGRITTIRRTSSCPPLDIQAALAMPFDGPKSSQAPSRRQKAYRGATTMPYPTSVYNKHSRSVSPPMSPSERASFEVTPHISPIEGPFANSSFNFVSPTAVRPPPPPLEGIAPNDCGYSEPPSSSPTITHSYYEWNTDSPSPSPIHTDPYYQSIAGVIHQTDGATGLQVQTTHSLSAQSSCSDLSSTFGPLQDRSWNWTSDFDWVAGSALEDETGSSSAPPSTPDGSSPVVTFSHHLPLEEVPYPGASLYPDVERIPEPAIDLQNYGKGLRLFAPQPLSFSVPEPITSPDEDLYSPQFQIPQVNISHLSQNHTPCTNPMWSVPHYDQTPRAQVEMSISQYEF